MNIDYYLGEGNIKGFTLTYLELKFNNYICLD